MKEGELSGYALENAKNRRAPSGANQAGFSPANETRHHQGGNRAADGLLGKTVSSLVKG